MVRGNMVRTRFGTFVIVLLGLACIVGLGYVFFGHPGDPKGNVKPLDTSSLSLLDNSVA